MDNKDILERAIQKAIDGGWTAEGLGGAEEWQELPVALRQAVIYTLLAEGEGNGYMLFIFNHDFAKALWGVTKTYLPYEEAGVYLDITKDTVACDGWKYHLQQMVIADDSIKYLGENM